LNEGANVVLEMDDAFCLKILLCNLENITFANKYQELKSKQKKA
jgi:hypothetical protein